MSFSDLLSAKIAARRKTGSGVKAAAQTLQDQALERVRDVYDAVVEMTGRLAEDPAFAAGFGKTPAVHFEWLPDAFGGWSTLRVGGRVGTFIVEASDTHK